jgi:hypothetical protein
LIENSRTTAFAAAAAADIAAPGSSPEIEITLEDGTLVPAEPPDSGPIGTSPIAIDFGAVVRAQQATAKAFLIKNLGVDPLAIGDITLPRGFVLLQSPPATIAPGESGKVVIGLDTTTAGGYVGPVVVASDDPDEPLLAFRIAGDVLPPISITSIDARRVPTSIVSGAAQPRRPITVTLRNETETPFADSLTIAAYASSDSSLDTGDTKLAELVTNARLPAGRERTFKLTLPPDAFPAGDTTLLAGLTAADDTDSRVGPQIVVSAPFVSLTSGPATGAPRSATVTAKPGRPMPLRLSITNGGNVSTTLTPATFRVEASTDGSAENVIASTSFAAKLRIAPGQTRIVKIAPTFPADAVPAGEYQLRVTVNAESNDTNDTFLVTLPVQFA